MKITAMENRQILSLETESVTDHYLLGRIAAKLEVRTWGGSEMRTLEISYEDVLKLLSK